MARLSALPAWASLAKLTLICAPPLMVSLSAVPANAPVFTVEEASALPAMVGPAPPVAPPFKENPRVARPLLVMVPLGAADVEMVL